MKEELFRKKSIEKIKSPESLNDCIRVAKPGVWMVFAAVAILLVGALIWGFFGRIETRVPVTASVKNGIAICSIENQKEKITDKMTLVIDGEKYSIEQVNEKSVSAPAEISDGEYDAEIITESIKPISFIFN